MNVNKIKRKLQPRLTWWKGNYWDIGDVLIFILFFTSMLPVLPVPGRHGSNYLIFIGKISEMAKITEKYPANEWEEALALYEQKYKNIDYRKCKISKDILLSMMVRNQELAQEMRKTNSNVPVIFVMEYLFLPLLLNTKEPIYKNIIIDVAESCRSFEGEFLNIDLVEKIYKINHSHHQNTSS